MSSRDLCRCGVYRYVHEADENGPSGIPCKRFRKATPPEVWLQTHSLRHHVAAWLWLKVPETWRWTAVTRVHKAMPDLCWCDLVDGALAKRDPSACLCDVSLPVARRLKPEDYGKCYCSPAEMEQA